MAELTPEAKQKCVEMLLEYSGTPMRHLYEYPHRADDSDRYIANAKKLLDQILEITAAPVVVNSVEELVMTRAGLALANTAFGEGLSAGIRACNAAHRRQPFKNPVSPYSAPLLAMIKADKQVEE